MHSGIVGGLVIGYLVVMFTIGIIMYQRSRNYDDYLIAGRKFNVFFIAMTLAAGISSATLGVAGLGHLDVTPEVPPPGALAFGTGLKKEPTGITSPAPSRAARSTAGWATPPRNSGRPPPATSSILSSTYEGSFPPAKSFSASFCRGGGVFEPNNLTVSFRL